MKKFNKGDENLHFKLCHYWKKWSQNKEMKYTIYHNYGLKVTYLNDYSTQNKSRTSWHFILGWYHIFLIYVKEFHQ